ncbi:uncharacterized protein LOC129768489 [Toxorhynchites rutilus septentrionalis]|uniref:uncharacterized protein LOC129768489 n=1 Tax=Toxorhynchites rutilus septentrionalis TaxID=329112 RepID=UPI00247AF3C4|nr:uncharacterized protein LOC129768489 [Toxorhynchites rutilus septentrionalis]
MAPPVPAATFPVAMAFSRADFNSVSTTVSSGCPTGKGYHFNEDTLRLIDCVKARPALWHRKHLRQRVQVAHRGWEEIRQAFKATDVKSLKVRWKTIRDSFRREVKRLEDGEISSSSWPLFDRMSFLIGHFRTARYYKRGSLSSDPGKAGDESWKYKQDSLSEEDHSVAAMIDSDGDVIGSEYGALHGSGFSGGSLIADSDPEDLTAFEPLPVAVVDDNSQHEAAHDPDLMEVPPLIYGEVTFKNKLRARTRAEPKPEPKPEISCESDSDYSFLMSLHPFMKKLSGKKNLSVRIKIQQLIAEAMEEE